MSPLYNEERIRKNIPEAIRGVFIYEKIDSTNTEARRYALSEGAVPAVFLAERQTEGRGRMGRGFYSPKKTGIYFSLLLPKKGRAEDTLLMTSAAAVAVRRAIAEVSGRDTRIKWVNDLYYEGKKVCGILCESLSLGEGGFIIVGVGINLSTESFPEDVAPVAGALGVSPEKIAETLAASCISRLYGIWNEIPTVSFIEEYKRYSMVLGKEIRYVENGVTYEGVAEDIDGNGHLYVRDDKGQTHVLSSGEISVRVKNIG